ncbi:hypothetical protein NDU88_004064 [Pleurodeles waltl]|uniref:Uncharacterized protein n=1 Tax=Pleurodeles waltl TaxID=8319 RepID=A0AAV7N0G4_PLEWA|nr:hypothetical protein NDU88_004064 [Pleurodeles waltl]
MGDPGPQVDYKASSSTLPQGYHSFAARGRGSLLWLGRCPPAAVAAVPRGPAIPQNPLLNPKPSEVAAGRAGKGGSGSIRARPRTAGAVTVRRLRGQFPLRADCRRRGAWFPVGVANGPHYADTILPRPRRHFDGNDK